MTSYGQFCSIARAHEVLGGRWTLLVVRELLCGSRRFNDIRRGIPRISKTMLSERLQELIAIGAVERHDGNSGPEYELTASGKEISSVVMALGTWGQRFLPRQSEKEISTRSRCSSICSGACGAMRSPLDRSSFGSRSTV